MASSKDMESLFKFVFFLAAIVFCVVIVGFFLLIVKFTLNFVPEINMMGITMIGQ